MRILFLIIFFFPNILTACFCAKPEVDEIDFEYYEEIFLGKIKTINKIEFPMHEDFTAMGEEMVFEVKKKWKGSNSKFIKLYQINHSCADPFLVESKDSWIILATKKTYPNSLEIKTKYLLTDGCEPIFEKIDTEDFNKLKNLLNNSFPKEIQLKNKNKKIMEINYLALGFVVIMFILGFVYGQKSKNPNG